MGNYSKRDARWAFVREESAKNAEANKKPKRKAPLPPTLREELQDGYRWFWFRCPNCGRRTPRAIAAFAIRYGMNFPTVDIARFATCQNCRHVGALLERPAMIGVADDLILEPFPVQVATRGLEGWIARVTRTREPAALRGRWPVDHHGTAIPDCGFCRGCIGSRHETKTAL